MPLVAHKFGYRPLPVIRISSSGVVVIAWAWARRLFAAGLAMACVKDDDDTITWDAAGMAQASVYGRREMC